HPQCSLRLESDLVSRQHVVIKPGASTLRIEDVSTNGTIAGDLLLRRDSVDVPYGTPIVVGDYTVFVYPYDPSKPAGAPPPRPPPAPSSMPRLPPSATAASPGNGAMARSAAISAAMTGQVPAVTGMNPVIAHVGAAPPPQGVHLPSRAESARGREDVELRREIHRLLLE